MSQPLFIRLLDKLKRAETIDARGSATPIVVELLDAQLKCVAAASLWRGKHENSHINVVVQSA